MFDFAVGSPFRLPWVPLKKTLGLVFVLGFVLLNCTRASAAITRVSVDTAGVAGNQNSSWSSISDNGRYVVFESAANNLVAVDGNGKSDIFIRDTRNNTTARISLSNIGGDATGDSNNPRISADGRYVAFDSDAFDLVAGDVNGFRDVFLRDTQTNTTTRISVNTVGGDANFDSKNPSISADGRYVAFESRATNLVIGVGDIGWDWDVFVRDTQTNTTIQVSVDTTGGEADGNSEKASISPDGRYVGFNSNATNLVIGDGNGDIDVFLRDIQTNTTTRVSVSSTGGDPIGNSVFPSVSRNGRYVAFESAAGNLVAGDNNLLFDIFVRDTLAATTTRISVDTNGLDANGRSEVPVISADGRYVAFRSDATDLVAGTAGLWEDIFIRDTRTNTTKLVSVNTTGGDPDGDSVEPAISSDGSYVSFHSGATDLVAGDANGRFDVFVANNPVWEAPAQAVPTLSQWGMILMAALMAFGAIWCMRKKTGLKSAE